MLQVKWLYKKADLDHVKLGIPADDYNRFIGENEIFPCEQHLDVIFADAIVSKAQVHSIKEYDEIQQIDFNTTFFTRASYDPVHKTL